MAKISLVIAIVVTLLTAGLAFVTKTKVDDLQGSLKTTKNNLTSTQSKLSHTESDLKERTESLATMTKDRDDKQQQLTAANAERDEQKKKADDIASQMADKDKQVADAKSQLETIQKQFEGVDPAQLGANVKKAQEDLAKATTDLAEKDQIINTLRSQVGESTRQVETANNQLKRYRDNIALNSFTGRIVAVNPGWNFVVLDVGDKQGATVNTPLIVVRNGQNIGKVKITSVEPSTSIADVVPGSMARGQFVQPGDQVVFTAKRGVPAGAGGQPAQPPAGAASSANNSVPLPSAN